MQFMDKETIENRLLNIFDEIKVFLELERNILEMPEDQIISKRDNLLKDLMTIEESLDSLRLWVKYLFFDMAANREEKH